MAEGGLLRHIDYISPNMVELCAIADTLHGTAHRQAVAGGDSQMSVEDLMSLARELTEQVRYHH